MKKALILVIAVILAGCGTARPVLYPNSQMQQTGDARAQQDIDECTRKAEAYVKENPAGDVAKSTATGAIVGAAVGAAIGAITGDFGQGLAIGASSGGIWVLRRALPGRRAKPCPQAIRRAVPEREGVRADRMEIAADAAVDRASGFRLENQIPLNPPLIKGEERGIFFCLLTYGECRL